MADRRVKQLDLGTGNELAGDMSLGGVRMDGFVLKVALREEGRVLGPARF